METSWKCLKCRSVKEQEMQCSGIDSVPRSCVVLLNKSSSWWLGILFPFEFPSSGIKTKVSFCYGFKSAPFS